MKPSKNGQKSARGKHVTIDILKEVTSSQQSDSHKAYYQTNPRNSVRKSADINEFNVMMNQAISNAG